MLRQRMSTRPVISILMILQIIPIVIFPLSLFTINNQDWWLPVLLAIFTIIGFVEIVFRHTMNNWPWYLMSFAQGFNIISRLMMLMPHATYTLQGAQVFNTPYVIITVISIVLSAFFLSYTDWPEVRRALSA